jgi:hypothetical protein
MLLNRLVFTFSGYRQVSDIITRIMINKKIAVETESEIIKTNCTNDIPSGYFLENADGRIFPCDQVFWCVEVRFLGFKYIYNVLLS